MLDIFGSAHSTTREAAVAAYEEAVWAVVRHQRHALTSLEEARALDPQMPAVDALEGLALASLARGDCAGRITARLASTRQLLERAGGGTAFEQALCNALALASEGGLLAASHVLSKHAARHPGALVCDKLSYAFRFMTGDSGGMLALTSRALATMGVDAPGHAYLLGCHSFALEEAGRFDEAEAVGREAVERAPDDAWGMHAVSHVFDMRGQVVEGINWLSSHRGVWKRCNNFALHMAWHQALLHLERGEHEVALAIYDAEVRPTPSSDYRDIANAVSMLVRLEQYGVAIDRGRWAAIASDAADRAADATLVFASLHALLALIRAQQHSEADELVRSLEAAAKRRSEQARVAANVGVALAHVLLGWARRQHPALRLTTIAQSLEQIGGSRVQRDIFVRCLAMIAKERGEQDALENLLSLRGPTKQDDVFAQIMRRGRDRSPLTSASIGSLP